MYVRMSLGTSFWPTPERCPAFPLPNVSNMFSIFRCLNAGFVNNDSAKPPFVRSKSVWEWYILARLDFTAQSASFVPSFGSILRSWLRTLYTSLAQVLHCHNQSCPAHRFQNGSTRCDDARASAVQCL